MRTKKYSVFVTFSIAPIVIFAFAASGQTTQAHAQGKQPSSRHEIMTKSTTGQMPKTSDAHVELKLTDEEARMVQGSRAAIIDAGFSAGYFDAHFSLSRVVNASNDRRVLWRYSLGEYNTVVNDTLGSYTDAKGRRIDTHSARTTLRGAHDVLHVIPKRRAERIMRSCIGAFKTGAVVMQADGAEGRTALVFTAISIPKPRRADRAEREERERRERTKKEASKGARGQTQRDVLEEDEGEGDGEPLYIGSINLETGRCVKGEAIADHPVVRRKH
jgi:hypothetical protein